MGAVEVNRGSLRLLLVAGLAALLALVWLRPLDDLAEREIDAGFQRALTSFAAARTLNAVLSAAQSATVDVQIGIGGSIQPGAILEPIDDLVEQFSALMLASTIAFACERLLLLAFASWPFTALLSLLLVANAAWLFWRPRAPRWLLNAAVLALCLRLVIPLLALTSEATYQLVLAPEYSAAQAELRPPTFATTPLAEDAGIAERVRHWLGQGGDLRKNLEALKQRVEGMAEHMIRLAAVFVVQTVILPLAFLTLLMAVLRRTLAPWRRA